MSTYKFCGGKCPPCSTAYANILGYHSVSLMQALNGYPLEETLTAMNGAGMLYIYNA